MFNNMMGKLFVISLYEQKKMCMPNSTDLNRWERRVRSRKRAPFIGVQMRV